MERPCRFAADSGAAPCRRPGGWLPLPSSPRPCAIPVNEAYRLTLEEVRLMWTTAPPRMPLVPETDAPEPAEDEAAA